MSMQSQTTPAYLVEGYPVIKKTVAGKYEIGHLYELSCTNPGCQFIVRVRGEKVEEIFRRLQQSGCPACRNKYEGNRKVVQFSFSIHQIDFKE